MTSRRDLEEVAFYLERSKEKLAGRDDLIRHIDEVLEEVKGDLAEFP